MVKHLWLEKLFQACYSYFQPSDYENGFEVHLSALITPPMLW